MRAGERMLIDTRLSLRERINRSVDRMLSFALAALSMFSLTASVIVESFHSARLAAVLFGLLLLHLTRYAKFVFNREAAIYSAFILYMVLALLWTDDVRLALNTLIPAVAFLITFVLFSSLAAYHDSVAMLAGSLCGVLLGAAAYTLMYGFPFAYPTNFSYNSIAGMYLGGLFAALLANLYLPSRGGLLLVTLLFFGLIVATTSIKFNLGVLLGAAAAGLLYTRQVLSVIKRNIIVILVVAVVLAYLLLSNDFFVSLLERGTKRILLGLEVLQARENVPGYSAFESREQWQSDGIAGWLRNPLFGHGVEAFRSKYGITSHSTPVDLLYNVGLIGCALFYAVFGSLAWRLIAQRRAAPERLDALIFGVWVCYLFISLSAPLHYSTFFAVYVAVSVVFRDNERRTASNAGVRT